MQYKRYVPSCRLPRKGIVKKTMAKSKSLKIAVVLEDLLVGGTVLVTLKYSTFLARAGYDVTLIVIEGDRRELDIDQWNEFKHVIFNAPCSLKELSELMDGFDAVIISNGALIPFPLEASRFTKRPLIVEVLHNYVRSALAPSVDITVAVSEAVFRSMQPRDNDFYLNNGVDVVIFKPGKRKKRDRVRLIQIAREAKPMKPDLGEVVYELHDEGIPVEAVLIGKEGPSDEFVNYMGVQPYSSIPGYLQQADILLHMADSEPFGLTAIEAMATGVIPIVSKTGGLAVSVEDGKSGYLVSWSDKEEVKKIIRKLVDKICLNDPEILQMRERGIKRVREHFNIEKQMRQLGEIIEVKARELPRNKRSTSYPFSFAASSLFYLHHRSDHYFKAMNEIIRLDDLDEEINNWETFYSYVIKEFRNYYPIMEFLNGVYCNLARDMKISSARKETVISYWLAIIALHLQRHDILIEKIRDGIKSDYYSVTASSLKKIMLSLVYVMMNLMKISVSNDLLETSILIKNNYLLDNIKFIEQLEMPEEHVTETLERIGLPGNIIADPYYPGSKNLQTQQVDL